MEALATLRILIELKLAIVRNTVRRLTRRSKLEFFTLLFFLIAAAGGLFFFFYHSFRFFSGHEPFGPLLMEETFYLFNFALFVMLLISSGVSAYTSLFRSDEIPFLLTRPASWTDVYLIKLAESVWLSSWAFLLIVIPFMSAYGLVKQAHILFFPMLCFGFYIPFVILAGTLGTLGSTLAVWYLPSRRRRQIALLILVMLVILWFRQAHPEYIKEQGSIAGILSGYLPQVSYAKHPLLPSYWTAKGILLLSEAKKWDLTLLREGLFYFCVLFSNALFFMIPSWAAAKGLYPATYLKSQDHGQIRKTRRVLIRTGMEKLLDRTPWPSKPARAFFEKDVKTFLRDPSEWSQLIIFFGLLVLYFANLRNLEFHILKDFWRNIVFVLNTVGTYIVLSSFSMRFVFPMISLEGGRAWMIGVAPIRFASVLRVKLVLGCFVSMALTLPLIFFSGWMLEIPMHRVAYTTGLAFFVCIALTGMSVGFGAKFPNFRSNNPSEIISGFGGSMLLMAHLSYLALIGIFLMLSKEPGWPMLTTVAAGSLLAGIVPIRMGIHALKKMEF